MSRFISVLLVVGFVTYVGHMMIGSAKAQILDHNQKNAEVLASVDN